MSRILMRYFGDRLKYWQLAKLTKRGLRPPEGLNFMKTHDRKLTEHYRSPVVVQFRNAVDSLASLYRFKVKKKGFDDSYDRWFQFAINNLSDWRGFRAKWVDPGKYPVVHYESLVEDPLGNARKVVELFLIEPEEVDEGRLEEAVGAEEIQQTNSFKQFKHYREEDEKFLQTLADL